MDQEKRGRRKRLDRQPQGLKAALSLENCRKLSEAYGELSDSQLELLRDQIIGLAEMVSTQAARLISGERKQSHLLPQPA